MILPDGHENMTDDELRVALLAAGYDEDGADAVIAFIREDEPIPVD